MSAIGRDAGYADASSESGADGHRCLTSAETRPQGSVVKVFGHRVGVEQARPHDLAQVERGAVESMVPSTGGSGADLLRLVVKRGCRPDRERSIEVHRFRQSPSGPLWRAHSFKEMVRQIWKAP